MAANQNQVPAQVSGQVPADAWQRKDHPAREGRRVATAVGRAGTETLDFRTLYDTWFADVARWVRALGASTADQDDLVQEVFVVVHRRLPDFDGENLAGWLYRIAT